MEQKAGNQHQRRRTGSGRSRRGLRGVPTSGEPSEPAGPGLSSFQFADVARRLSAACDELQLRCPEFRSPGHRGTPRTLRRRSDGSVVVSVDIRQRPIPSILADMIDGILATNRLVGRPDLRDPLWAAAAPAFVYPTDQAVA